MKQKYFFFIKCILITLQLLYLNCVSGNKEGEPLHYLELSSSYSMAIDSSDNVYILGSGENLIREKSGLDWWIKKYDSGGNEDITNWNKVYDGKGNSSTASACAIDSFDNVYILGYHYELQNNHSIWYWWIKKYSSVGTEDTIYRDKIFETNINAINTNSLTVDSTNVYIIGNRYRSLYKYDWWIKKYDANASEDIIGWNKYFSQDKDIEKGQSITIDSSNNIYAVGYGENSSDCGEWGCIYEFSYSNIKKFDSIGNEDLTNWDKMFTDSEPIRIHSIVSDPNDNVYIIGSGENIVNGTSNLDWWIKKFDSDGNEDSVNWNKQIDGNGNADSAYSVAIDSSLNVYIAGYGTNVVNNSSLSDWWIKKFDQDGDEDTVNWDKKFNLNDNNDIIYSMAIDSNDNVYVLGIMATSATSSTSEWHIKKFNASGSEDTTNWNKQL